MERGGRWKKDGNVRLGRALNWGTEPSWGVRENHLETTLQECKLAQWTDLPITLKSQRPLKLGYVPIPLHRIPQYSKKSRII
ncbi:hypothetical protein M407DRAFT_245931 [Tulasnella calospora MUT 4182]|uniref:Uncharacterized protein n=1 Tax=Tulasnella calospora MUT 4182 TaxID=1051891 RepID=A0A0C3Q7S5_9AGAM|nr:hypothetical protein M407DRAFT_245931 [Tulasnella calospora MUT 4182]